MRDFLSLKSFVPILNSFNKSTAVNAYVFIHNAENIKTAVNNSDSTDNSLPASIIYSFFTCFAFAIVLAVCLNGSRKYLQLRNLGIQNFADFWNLRFRGMTRRTARSDGAEFLDEPSTQVRNTV